ncbi:MAG: phage tail tube protein [Eubacterium sp.]|nr:phage tail tube protein [Eubacterium sp.]
MVNKQVFTGHDGKVYLDGEVESYIKEIEVKVTGNFDDLELCGTYETESVYTGYTTEGTATVYMTSTDYADNILETFESGYFPERTIVSTLTNKNSGATCSYSIPNVVFTEVTVVKQGKGAIELSLPFKCGLPKKL